MILANTLAIGLSFLLFPSKSQIDDIYKSKGKNYFFFGKNTYLDIIPNWVFALFIAIIALIIYIIF